MNKKILLLLDALVSIVLIVGILYYIGADKIVAEFANIDYFCLFLSIVFLVIMHIIIIFRIKLLLDENKASICLKEIGISHMVGMLLADFTPGRSGYFATVATLHYNYKVPSDKAMVAILGPQTLDFITKVVAGAVALFYIAWYVLKIDDVWFIGIAAGIMSLMILVMLLLLFSARFLKLFAFVRAVPVLKRLYSMTERMQRNSHTVIRKLPELLVLLFLSWTAKAVSWYFVAKSLGITLDIGFPEPVLYYFIQPLLTMLEFMPTPTIAGIGLSEGGGAVLLSLFGVSAAKAASFVFLARVKTTFVNLIAVPEMLKVAKNLKSDIL